MPHWNLNGNFLTSIISFQLSRLEDLHSIGYVHCDLKPDNILIEDEDSQLNSK